MNLTDFLIELASDPKKAAKFTKKPKKVMKKAGLSKEDRKLLLSGDSQAIRDAVDSEKFGDQIVTIIFVSVILDGSK